jgi:hypothetical protein
MVRSYVHQVTSGVSGHRTAERGCLLLLEPSVVGQRTPPLVNLLDLKLDIQRIKRRGCADEVTSQH